MKRPSLLDVARRAGVSHMTVSRVVRGIQRVAPLTEEKVRRAIAELGYSPDPTLSALAAYRANSHAPGDRGVLAFLDCDRTEFSRHVIRGAEGEARSLGYRIERFALDPSPAKQARLGRTLFHRGVRGLLFGPSNAAWTFSGWIWDEFACVSLGALSHQPRLHQVAIDYFHGAFTACEILWGKGCRRIGFAVDPALEARTEHRWLGGYLACLASRGANPLHYEGNVRHRPIFRSWARRNRIDGLVTIHAPLATLLGQAATAFLNNLEAPTGAACLQLDSTSIGSEGVRLLHHLLLRGDFGLPAQPKMVALQGRWSLPHLTGEAATQAYSRRIVSSA